jgi:hypothetical protein
MRYLKRKVNMPTDSSQEYTKRILKTFIASDNKVFMHCQEHGKVYGVIVELGDDFVVYACCICVQPEKEPNEGSKRRHKENSQTKRA